VGSTRFRDEWRRQWFALPYTPNPERDRYFAIFFSQDWKNTLLASLETFLSTILSALPTPRMVSLASAKDSLESLKAEVESLKLARKEIVNQTMNNVPVRVTELDSILPGTSDPGTPRSEHIKSQESFSKNIIGRRNGEILRARFSPSCTYAAGCGRDATSVIWSFTGSSQKNPRLFCDSTSSCMDWFDDSFLCVGTLDHSIHLWHPPTSGNPSSKVNTLRTAVTMPWVLDVAFDPSSSSGSTLIASVAPAITSQAGELQVWNIQTERLDRILPLEPVPTRVNSLRFNHNGSLLVAGSADGMVRVFDTSRSGAIMGWPAFTQGNGVCAICLSRSETSVFALSSNGRSLVEWSLHRVGEALRKWSISENVPKFSPKHYYQHADISTSGKRIALAHGGRGTVLSLEASSEATLNTEETILDNIAAVDWDENLLLAGGVDGLVCTYSL
jgi:WD40 repeat protein